MDILVRAIFACVPFVVFYFVQKFFYYNFISEYERKDRAEVFFTYAFAVPTTMVILSLMYFLISLFHWVLFGS